MTHDPRSKNSIILLVDGLRPSSLGPYGNTWFDTTRLNQLASESMVFEQCISDSPNIQLGVRGILQGIHACDNRREAFSLLNGLAETDGVRTLVTSQPEKFADYHDDFSTVIEVKLPEQDALTSDISETDIAVFFSTAIEAIGQLDEPGTLLLDCPGFVNRWDAPYTVRQSLADPDDPEPSNRATAPSLQFNPAVDDPDLLLDFQVAYGAQVSIFDELMEVLLQEIEKSRWGRNAMFCLTATRAFPLGEHGVVGYYRNVLYNECVHVPLIIRWPRAVVTSVRSQQLVQPGSLFDLLVDWHGLAAPHQSQFASIDTKTILPKRLTSAVIMTANNEDDVQLGIQTASWKQLFAGSRQLYVKPDDVWEYNDVADLCSQASDELEQCMRSAATELSDGRCPTFQLEESLDSGF